MQEMADKIKTIRKELKKSQQEMADICGIPARTWANYETGISRIPVNVLLALEKLGYSVDSIIKPASNEAIKNMKSKNLDSDGFYQERMELAKQYPPDTPIDALPSAGENLFRFKNGHTVPVPALKSDSDALVLIPVYGQRASAGPGQPPANLPDIESYIPILYEMLGGANPKNCGCVRVVGDSMVDMSLFNGDIVIFDRTQMEGDGVYVISIGSDVRVKHLEYRAFEKKIIISSENSRRYPNPETISYEQAENLLCIHGKVICWMHKHPY